MIAPTPSEFLELMQANRMSAMELCIFNLHVAADELAKATAEHYRINAGTRPTSEAQREAAARYHAAEIERDKWSKTLSGLQSINKTELELTR